MTEIQEITYFAKTFYRNKEVRFGIYKPDRRHHMYILGKTGMGKTTLMSNLIKSDLENGQGLAVFDPHGDLTKRTLDMLPKRRKNDLVYFNPVDQKYALPFNLLNVRNSFEKQLITSGIISIFKKLFNEFWGPRTEHVLRNCILTLLEHPGKTLLDIPFLLTEKNIRKKWTQNLKDPIVKAFWEKEYELSSNRFRQEMIAPILNKIGQFSTNSLIRNILGKGKNKINFQKVIDNKKILIVDLSKGQIGEESVSLLGTCLLTQIQLTALKRNSLPYDKRQDFYIYIDEFHEFATNHLVSMLPEARKFHLNFVIAHQYLNQLDDNVKNSVIGNIGTHVLFRLGADDAKLMAKEFSERFIESDFMNLSKFQFNIKMMIDGVGASGFSGWL